MEDKKVHNTNNDDVNENVGEIFVGGLEVLAPRSYIGRSKEADECSLIMIFLWIVGFVILGIFWGLYRLFDSFDLVGHSIGIGFGIAFIGAGVGIGLFWF